MDHSLHANIDELWDYNDPRASEQRFYDLQSTHGRQDDLNYQMTLRTQLARALGLQRKFDLATAALDQVESALPRLNHIVQGRYYLERGRVLNSSGSPDQAVPMFEEALRLAKLGGHDFTTVDAAHMLGIAAPPADRMKWNLYALELAAASKDARARKWQGSLCNNIGWTYHDAAEYELALEVFEKALAFRIEQGGPKNIQIAKWCIGRCYRSLGRVAEALEIQQTLFRETPDADDPDPYVCEELGECLLALGRKDETSSFFQEAYNQLKNDPWFVANEPDRLSRLKDLARIITI